MIFYDKLFNDSFERLLPAHDRASFLDAFYSTFIHRTSEIEDFFLASNSELMQRLIHKSFFAMLAVNNNLFVPDYLEKLARNKDDEGIRLPPRFYVHWRSALLETVQERDAECDEEVITAWAMMIATGLEYMRRQAEIYFNDPQVK